MQPATIRYNNPGAQYPGRSSKKFGSKGYKRIGGGHKIATFPSKVAGAAALFDLFDRGYTNRTLEKAVRKWSGGNWVKSYLSFLADRGGLKPSTKITKKFMGDEERAIGLAKAMSWHETGRRYPMTDAEWREAHRRFLDARS